MPTFYRILDETTLKTKQRWEQGNYTSSHGSAPTVWYDVWAGSQSEDIGDYKRDFWWGIHTEAAVQSFIDSMKCHKASDIWPQEELNATGELNGVCAWKTREEAWAHAILPGQLDDTWIVEFEGIEMCGLPEQAGGGVQVRVDAAGHIYSAEEFAKEYGFDLP